MSETAAIYVRQSVNHPEGIERALARTRALVAQRGWSLSEQHVFTDNDVSAKGGKRSASSGWGQLLKALRAREVTVVVSVDLDRLMRSISDLGVLIKEGAKVTVVDGDLDLTTADGKLRASILTAAAEFEVNRKSERQLRANEYRVSQGKPVPGRRRFGYEPDNMTVRSAEAVQVLWAYEQIKAGKSLRSIATSLDMRPIRVREMLANPSYRGDVVHKGVAMPSSLVTPIVTPEVWAEVAAIMADPARKTSPGAAVRHVASGIAECGICGHKLVVRTGYMCDIDTAHVWIQKATLDSLISEEVFQWIVEHPDAEGDAEDGPLTPLLAESAELSRQRGVLQDMAMWEGADLADIRKKLAALSRRAEEVEVRIAAQRGAQTRSGVLEAVRFGWWERRGIAEYTELEQAALDAWPAYWDALPLETQREIVRSMFKVTVNKGRGTERVIFDWLG